MDSIESSNLNLTKGAAWSSSSFGPSSPEKVSVSTLQSRLTYDYQPTK